MGNTNLVLQHLDSITKVIMGLYWRNKMHNVFELDNLEIQHALSLDELISTDHIVKKEDYKSGMNIKLLDNNSKSYLQVRIDFSDEIFPSYNYSFIERRSNEKIQVYVKDEKVSAGLQINLRKRLFRTPIATLLGNANKSLLDENNELIVDEMFYKSIAKGYLNGRMPIPHDYIQNKQIVGIFFTNYIADLVSVDDINKINGLDNYLMKKEIKQKTLTNYSRKRFDSLPNDALFIPDGAIYEVYVPSINEVLINKNFEEMSKQFEDMRLLQDGRKIIIY